MAAYSAKNHNRLSIVTFIPMKSENVICRYMSFPNISFTLHFLYSERGMKVIIPKQFEFFSNQHLYMVWQTIIIAAEAFRPTVLHKES